MAIGYLKVVVVEEIKQNRINQATVIVEHSDLPAVTFVTDQDGITPIISLETVDKELSMQPEFDQAPFFTYRVIVQKEGYQEAVRDNVYIFDDQTATLFVEMIPIGTTAVSKIYDIPWYAKDNSKKTDIFFKYRKQGDFLGDAIPALTMLDTPLLPTPIIPNVITVKLGTPQSDAEVITVDYVYYLKNVASSEIFPTWPEEALRANIYAIQSIALNRVYTEWYRQRGYDFQITSSTAFDQKFIKDRVIYDNISQIVDETYQQYIHRMGYVEPMFTAFCDGRKVKCDGLHQWETVDYANLGYSAFEILQQFYGDNIQIATSAIIQDITESFTEPLSIGSVGHKVLLMQIYLLRISVDYPSIPQPFPLDGVYDDSFAQSVEQFQRVFKLPVTGVIDRETWYKISFIYHGVKRLAQLTSEGIISPTEYMGYTGELRIGDTGTKVLILQYGLNVIAGVVPDIPRSAMDAKFGPKTKQMVEIFQRHVGLPVTGVVDETTWETIRQYYLEVTLKLPASFELMEFPGRHFTVGDEGLEVQTIQQYLNTIGYSYTTIPTIEPNGIFDETMKNQVIAFQREFNMNPTGVVDEATWNAIASIYRAVLPIVLYPGYILRFDDTNYYVAVLQDYINTVAERYPNIPTSVVDEWFGPETLASVIAFQQQFGLEPDGLVGKETWNKLLEVYVELTYENYGITSIVSTTFPLKLF